MYEEITKYANSIRTLDENAATEAALRLGETLASSSLRDDRPHETLAQYGIDDPWLANAEALDADAILAVLCQIQRSNFWCSGGWRSTVQSGYLERLLAKLSELDEAGETTAQDGQTTRHGVAFE